MEGQTLSHYRIIEKIGQGGMGEVYRAEDTSLKREVVIKSLNHPNIAAIHSFEHADGLHFLVLELVEGETLAQRVAKGPLPVEEALEVCRQIAEGVEAAHEKGVSLLSGVKPRIVQLITKAHPVATAQHRPVLRLQAAQPSQRCHHS